MHDPMVVAHEIRRPWPERSGFGDRDRRWKVTIYRKHGIDHEGWNPRRWWLPSHWSPFVMAFGRSYWFPPLITVWHVEPNDRDALTVCRHRVVDGDGEFVRYSGAWKWHVWHWRLQYHFGQKLKRFLFERCIECHKRFPWGYSPVSGSWDGPRARWFRRNELAYHFPCHALQELRRSRDTDGAIIRKLFAAFRLAEGLSESEALTRLTDAARNGSLEWHLGYRLQGILGFERNEQYELVKSAP